ncbi:MAG: hypothetical protein LC799_07415 [Actinobacteria bacterium]|nr:hypothetical protein [Actinomycetota bacterium]
MSLLADVRRVKDELFAAGGATIDTPEPPDSPDDAFAVTARTVVQPDGDVLVLVAERYCVDADLRRLHAVRVAAWFERLERTVTTTAVALRRAAVTLVSVIVTLSGLQTWRTSLTSGLVFLAAGSVLGLSAQAGLRLAAGHALRETDT